MQVGKELAHTERKHIQVGRYSEVRPVTPDHSGKEPFSGGFFLLFRHFPCPPLQGMLFEFKGSLPWSAVTYSCLVPIHCHGNEQEITCSFSFVPTNQEKIPRLKCIFVLRFMPHASCLNKDSYYYYFYHLPIVDEEN